MVATETVQNVAQNVEVTTEPEAQAESAPAQVSAPESAFLPAAPAPAPASDSQTTAPQQDLSPSQ